MICFRCNGYIVVNSWRRIFPNKNYSHLVSDLLCAVMFVEVEAEVVLAGLRWTEFNPWVEEEVVESDGRRTGSLCGVGEEMAAVEVEEGGSPFFALSVAPGYLLLC